jgi:hypothetical protein
MAGFYDDMIDDRHARIESLWSDSSGEYWEREMRRQQQEQEEHDDKQPDCILAEYMDVWASREEILHLLQNKVELEHLGNVFAQTARQLIETCKLLASGPPPTTWRRPFHHLAHVLQRLQSPVGCDTP